MGSQDALQLAFTERRLPDRCRLQQLRLMFCIDQQWSRPALSHECISRLSSSVSGGSSAIPAAMLFDLPQGGTF